LRCSIHAVMMQPERCLRHPRRSEGEARTRRGSSMRLAEGSVLIVRWRRRSGAKERGSTARNDGNLAGRPACLMMVSMRGMPTASRRGKHAGAPGGRNRDGREAATVSPWSRYGALDGAAGPPIQSLDRRSGRAALRRFSCWFPASFGLALGTATAFTVAVPRASPNEAGMTEAPLLRHCNGTDAAPEPRRLATACLAALIVRSVLSAVQRCSVPSGTNRGFVPRSRAGPPRSLEFARSPCGSI